jgi:membrane-bound metal-dependent hydrolase YbcI (DUF457 family)
MMALAHAGLGWAIGTAAPGSDRRLRIFCSVAALLPDLDALAILAGAKGLHYTLGHNIFAGALCVAAAAWYFRRDPDRTWLAAFSLVGLSFAGHLVIDVMLSGYELRLFWPLPGRGRAFHPLLRPGHPVTVILAWLLVALPGALAFWKQVTPLEILSPRLDFLFLNLFRRKKYACVICGRKCNNRCGACTQPVCFRHGKIGLRFRLTCSICGAKSAHKGTGQGVEDYLARELQFLRGKEAVALDHEFAAFVHRKLTDGLRRLDDVPRTHPLWQGSDQRPTLAKLVDLCRTVLRDAPDDDEARWVLFSYKVLKNSPDLGFSEIEPLILRDFGSLRRLVSAARWSYVFSAVDPVVALRAPFESLAKTVGPMEACLHALSDDKDVATKEAAGKCLELLKGKNPFVGQRVT